MNKVRKLLFNKLRDLFEDRPDQPNLPYGKIMEVLKNYEKYIRQNTPRKRSCLKAKIKGGYPLNLRAFNVKLKKWED